MIRYVFEDPFDTLTRERVHDEHRGALRDRLDGRPRLLRVGGEVCFGEQYDRHRSRIPRHREFALDAAKVGLVGDRVDDEHRVDIGGQYLDVGGASRVGTRDGAATGEDRLDEWGAGMLRGSEHRHPVADGG